MTIHVQFDQLIIDFLFTIIYVFYLQTFDDEMELDRGREKSRNLFEKRWIWTQASTSLNFYYPSFLLDPFIPYSRRYRYLYTFLFSQHYPPNFFFIIETPLNFIKNKVDPRSMRRKKKGKDIKKHRYSLFVAKTIFRLNLNSSWFYTSSLLTR